jgi:sulfur carrier protein
MLVLLNGEPRELAPGSTIADVIDSIPGTPAGRGVAVALDGEVIPRGQWQLTNLSDGSHVEVVVAVQGG